MKYELLDFGSGRKLESLGGYVVDRPSPAADSAGKSNPALWQQADAKFDSLRKQWNFRRTWPENLTIQCVGFQMPVHPTPFGHIGLFPEQFSNWQWLARNISEASEVHALNLFGYTGASTMALVSAGYAVTHVDAAKPNVDSARQAARINDWEDRSIRYLVEDAAKYAGREVRRKKHYHTIVLDPPAYGHGPTGKTWRIERDLWPLLNDCLRLLSTQNQPRENIQRMLLVTGHSESVGPAEIADHLKSRWPSEQSGLRIESSRSQLLDRTSRPLDAGFSVRVTFPPH